MVSRSEIDMKQIKEEYKKNYGKTLYTEILVSDNLATDDPKPNVDVTIAQFILVFSSGRHQRRL